MTNLKSNMRAHTHTLWVRRQPPKYLTQSNRTTSRTSYSAQFTTCYLFFGNNIWGTCHKLRVAFNGCFSAYEYFPSVLFLFLCFLFFICFFFLGFACECECICCSFHLNYPVADLLVTTWRCTILKQFASQSNTHWGPFSDVRQYSVNQLVFCGRLGRVALPFLSVFNQVVCEQILRCCFGLQVVERAIKKTTTDSLEMLQHDRILKWL